VLDVAGQQIDLPSATDAKAAAPQPNGQSALLAEHPALALLLVGGVLCNDALLEASDSVAIQLPPPTLTAIKLRVRSNVYVNAYDSEEPSLV
jgi:hypothetical protein